MNTEVQERVSDQQEAYARLCVLAQSPVDWSGWVERLSSAFGANTISSAVSARTGRGWRVELVAPSAKTSDATQGASAGDIRWIVLVDSPARHLALRLAEEPTASAPDKIAEWQTSATQLLGIVHHLHGRCVVLDSDETVTHPKLVAQWLAGWLGEELPEEALPVAPRPDALIAKLAEEYANSDRGAMALWSELQACCEPLPGLLVAEGSCAQAQSATVHHLARIQALLANSAQLATLLAGQEALRVEAKTAREEAALRHARLQNASDEVSALKAGEQVLRVEAQQAREEATLLQTQLHRVQEELEALFLQQQEDRKALGAARGERDSAQAALARQTEAAAKALTREQEEHRAKLAAQEAKSRELLAQSQKEERTKHAALEAQNRELKQEADLLLIQLHHVQEELEAHFLSLQATQRALALATAQAQAQALAQAQAQAAQADADADVGDARRYVDDIESRAAARQIEIVGRRSDPPHRELDLRMTDVTLGARQLPRVGVRLLEHDGRVGLGLVSLPDAPPPISQWRADGEDGRGPYMLFVPADENGRRRLAMLGTRNWQALLAFTALAQKATADACGADAAVWQVVAGRLRAALHALPARLRYDELAVRQDGETVHIQLVGAWYGDRPLPVVTIRWSLRGAGDGVHLVRTDDAKPLLADWPVADDGQLAEVLPLPIGRGDRLGVRLRWWVRQLPADRDLALALVDALAAAVELLPASADRAVWGAQAKRLRRNLDNILMLGRLGQRMRRTLKPQRG